MISAPSTSHITIGRWTTKDQDLGQPCKDLAELAQLVGTEIETADVSPSRDLRLDCRDGRRITITDQNTHPDPPSWTWGYVDEPVEAPPPS